VIDPTADRSENAKNGDEVETTAWYVQRLRGGRVDLPFDALREDRTTSSDDGVPGGAGGGSFTVTTFDPAGESHPPCEPTRKVASEISPTASQPRLEK
jgi:hypothetical protein